MKDTVIYKSRFRAAEDRENELQEDEHAKASSVPATTQTYDSYRAWYGKIHLRSWRRSGAGNNLVQRYVNAADDSEKWMTV